ncbi:MAG: hypothetical protein PHI31_05330 [Desulfuromonadaceae bacterium]|nr:hypothetical protein [Desulfuromonadaceae bacterium]
MGRQSISNTQVLLAFIMVFMYVVMCRAADGNHQFSLGGGHLTSAPSDAKEPEPGIVTARYGFKIAKDFMPYMGTGLAYTYQPDAWTGDITKLRTGMAAQFGFNYFFGINSILKLEYKYLTVTPEQQRSDLRTAPQSIGIGLDIKF